MARIYRRRFTGGVCIAINAKRRIITRISAKGSHSNAPKEVVNIAAGSYLSMQQRTGNFVTLVKVIVKFRKRGQCKTNNEKNR